MGMLYSKSAGRRAQAVDMLKRALAVSPNDLAFLKALAPLLAEMGSAEEASLCLNRAIALDPADNHRVVFTQTNNYHHAPWIKRQVRHGLVRRNQNLSLV